MPGNMAQQIGAASLLLASALLFTGASALANDYARGEIRQGVRLIGETTELEKTDAGAELRRIRSEYSWDDGLVYSYVHDINGKLLEVRRSYNGLRPDEQELAQAFALVWDDPEVQTIRRRQAGIEIDGGFTYREKTGSCALPSRCVQVFLFDGENVVRHMLVDLRSNRIVDRDYTPPRNLEQ